MSLLSLYSPAPVYKTLPKCRVKKSIYKEGFTFAMTEQYNYQVMSEDCIRVHIDLHSSKDFTKESFSQHFN